LWPSVAGVSGDAYTRQPCHTYAGVSGTACLAGVTRIAGIACQSRITDTGRTCIARIAGVTSITGITG
jgi:hypothetical protein